MKYSRQHFVFNDGPFEKEFPWWKNKIDFYIIKAPYDFLM